MTELETSFDRLRAASRAEPYPSLAVRLDRLARLAAVLRGNHERIAAAISDDFGQRARHETMLAEVVTCLAQIAHARRHLRRWMRPVRVPLAAAFRPGRAEVRHQPLGLVGIIAPWNYPVNLSFSPLVDVLAAGNRALLKLSEFTPRTAALLIELLHAAFSPDELRAFSGDAAVGRAFAALPFDHLVFTGSTAVGRDVMQSAARNLTPVTLELGGKSPTLIAPDYPLARAVPRIIYGKAFNAGQTCISPDYVLLPAGLEAGFEQRARDAFGTFYPSFASTPDYTSIVDERQRARLLAALDDARAGGARVVPLADPPGAGGRRWPVTLVFNPWPDSALMRAEIFGPVLPVLAYADWSQALEFVRARPRPLAVYLFDHDRARVEYTLRQIVAGAVVVNDVLWHVAQEGLPFGGVGDSGIGAYHGCYGFEAFSKPTAVYRAARWNIAGLIRPPITARMRSFINYLVRST